MPLLNYMREFSLIIPLLNDVQLKKIRRYVSEIFEKNEGESSSFGATNRVLTVILLVRKVSETLTLQKTGGERILHIVEKFLTSERARFYSRYICSLFTLCFK